MTLAWVFIASVAAAAPSSPASEPTPPASPRAALSQFLDLCRAGRYQEAARALDLSGAHAEDGPELARRLKVVLDRHVWFDLSRISPAPTGDADDGLPRGVDQIATVPGPGGSMPVRLVRIGQGEGARWVFSRTTVEQIDGWFAGLSDHWLLDHLPLVLLRPGPRELLWWQWMALLLLAGVSWIGGRGLGFASGRGLRQLTSRTANAWDDAVLKRLRGPLALAWSLVIAYLASPRLELYAPARAFLNEALRAGFLVAFFWGLLRTIDVVARLTAESAWANSHPSSRSLVPLGTRTLKVGVWAMAVIAVLSEFGYPVTSLIAGLGIGGLVLALAGQKTVENLFGAYSIGLDQPFREGDFVKIEDFVGTVERIGLRSTRFRTLDRTLISMPNGKLSELRTESFSVRDRIRLSCVVGLVYETTVAQMREVLVGLEAVLRGHPKIWPEAVVVRFSELGASSLNIDVMAWFQTADWGEFQQIRQEVLLEFMEVVERAGSGFAFPTQTLHLVRDRSPERGIAAVSEVREIASPVSNRR